MQNISFAQSFLGKTSNALEVITHTQSVTQRAQPWMQHKIMLNALKIALKTALKTPSFPFFPQACVQKLVIIKSTLVNQKIEIPKDAIP
jgi:hypothetical protein